MDTVLFASIIVVVICLLIMVAFQPRHNELSQKELRRRSNLGDMHAKANLEKELVISEAYELRTFLISVLLAILFMLLTIKFNYLIGFLIAVTVLLFCNLLSKLNIVKELLVGLHNKIEKQIIILKAKLPQILWLVGASSDGGQQNTGSKIGSRQELQFIIDSSSDILTEDEKTRILSGLSFSDKRVLDIMVPRDKIAFIKKSEFLGPLTLNELHKICHKRLPVIGSDLDHIVGILYLKSLLDLDIKKSTTAEKAMDTKVYYIHRYSDLSRALATFIKTHQDMLIVIDKNRQTVGLLTVDDVIQALLGQKLEDNFDEHESIHAVARSIKD